MGGKIGFQSERLSEKMENQVKNSTCQLDMNNSKMSVLSIVAKICKEEAKHSFLTEFLNCKTAKRSCQSERKIQDTS